MKVYINKHDLEGRVVGRTVVNAEVLETRKNTYLVKLPDGSVIVRKKGRDIPDAQQSKNKE